MDPKCGFLRTGFCSTTIKSTQIKLWSIDWSNWGKSAATTAWLWYPTLPSPKYHRNYYSAHSLTFKQTKKEKKHKLFNTCSGASPLIFGGFPERTDSPPRRNILNSSSYSFSLWTQNATHFKTHLVPRWSINSPHQLPGYSVIPL